MKYLVKDLARLTGLSPARIRKWQERYNLLRPEVGANGYHYYSSDDLFVLQKILRQLESGGTLSGLVEAGREGIFSARVEEGYDENQRECIALLAQGYYSRFKDNLDLKAKKIGMGKLLRGPLVELVRLVGSAWEAGYLGVADEHAFSRWFFGYVETLVAPMRIAVDPVWLVVVYPGDAHELGALLHYGDLLRRGIPARFCGPLDERDLMRELSGRAYRKLSVSVVMPRTDRELRSLRNRVRARFPGVSVLFGGMGYRSTVRRRIEI